MLKKGRDVLYELICDLLYTVAGGIKRSQLHPATQRGKRDGQTRWANRVARACRVQHQGAHGVGVTVDTRMPRTYRS